MNTNEKCCYTCDWFRLLTKEERNYYEVICGKGGLEGICCLEPKEVFKKANQKCSHWKIVEEVKETEENRRDE